MKHRIGNLAAIVAAISLPIAAGGCHCTVPVANAELSVRVFDSIRGENLPGATVTIRPPSGEPIFLRDPQSFGIYDSDPELPMEGEYTLSVTRSGYQDVTRRVVLTHATGVCEASLVVTIPLTLR